MLRVVESFSGIGSQVKALKNIGIEHEVIATIEWDINAIIAYDIIHYGPQDISEYEIKNKEELIAELECYTLSNDGKTKLTKEGFKRLGKETISRLLYAIKRSHNLGSITDVTGYTLSENTDLFTYSFPCQDLSIAGAWHGNNSGINRDANNRSGMLWEVERILLERFNAKIKLPKFLLMENVSNILSNTHIGNFLEWKKVLKSMGYINFIYKLNANDFGIPQKRERVYMLSVFCGENHEKSKLIIEYMKNNDLNNKLYLNKLNIKHKDISDILRLYYNSNEKYRKEANEAQPNDTKSRKKIYEENDKIFDGKNIAIKAISTITTKQDRHPNSGVIHYEGLIQGKSNFRYLTPRECFMLMGFEEKDFQALVDNNFEVCKNRKFFVPSKLYKLAGNSIVVNVLEYIFIQVNYINKNFFENK
ncbi:DNA (cytosine-5-)-methyltransferase [Clostridium tarantellae]|uniref:Cytosine-specific methyltransferase n=1 Tax=Clostridium tarantellae TaxID=39493 RepID=A0A6I1MM27_9CLOT|nr:DNA (cytosine-5-)-methyltransferase [Clostridium tarantellae]MPQ44064.1 DNA (cytosine-5-)-methyltransferase [Clostridium tarantellae]